MTAYPLLCFPFIFLYLLLEDLPDINNKQQNQTQVDTVRYQKGKTISILIGIRKEQTGQEWQDYINLIFPIATKYGYNPGNAFNVTGVSKGSYSPGFVSISSWPNAASRTNFQEDENLPRDLEDRRRMIWSRFDQYIIEALDHDISFIVTSGETYVFTSYWIDDQEKFDSYLTAEIKVMNKFGGRLLERFTKGYSPKNHLYNPAVIFLSAWNDLNSFHLFRSEMGKDVYEDNGTYNTQEFLTSYVFNF